MESSVRDASNRTYRILCKCHLLYDEKFMTDYFDTITRQEEESEGSKIEIKNVANSNRAQQQQRSRRRPQLSFRWKLALISHYIVFRIFFQTALWIFDSRISTRMQVLLLNPIALEHFDSYMQIFVILYLVFGRNLLPLVYVQNRGLTFRVLRDAIIKNRNSFFLESRFRFSNGILRFFAGPDDLISKQLLSLGIWISNMFYKMLNLFDLENLILIIVQMLMHNHHFTTFDYAIMWGSFTMNIFSIHTMFRILALMLLNGILTTIVAYVRLTQSERFVRRHFVRRRKSFIDTVTFVGFPTAAFYRFRVLIVSSMHFVADANRIYGKAFFDFILTNVPLNSLLIGMLITGKFRGPIKLIVIFIIAAQMFILIVMQVGAAVLTRRFHRSVKYFFRFIADPDLRPICGAPFAKQVAVVWHRNALRPKPEYENLANNKHTKIAKILNGDKCERQKQQISLRLRLQIARYIGDFHTSKQYTLNYGKHGAITFAAIQKQIFINFKLIFFSYMLYHLKKITKSEIPID